MKNVCLLSLSVLVATVLTSNAQYTNSGWVGATNSTAVVEVSDDEQFGEPQPLDLGGTTAIAEAVTPEIQALARGLKTTRSGFSIMFTTTFGTCSTSVQKRERN